MDRVFSSFFENIWGSIRACCGLDPTEVDELLSRQLSESALFPKPSSPNFDSNRSQTRERGIDEDYFETFEIHTTSEQRPALKSTTKPPSAYFMHPKRSTIPPPIYPAASSGSRSLSPDTGALFVSTKGNDKEQRWEVQPSASGFQSILMLTFDASFGETKVKFQDRDGCIRECTWEEFKSYPGAREAIKQTRYTVNELEDAASQSKEIGGITENFFI